MCLKGNNLGQSFSKDKLIIIVMIMIICSVIYNSDFVNPSISAGSFKFPKWPLLQHAALLGNI